MAAKKTTKKKPTQRVEIPRVKFKPFPEPKIPASVLKLVEEMREEERRFRASTQGTLERIATALERMAEGNAAHLEYARAVAEIAAARDGYVIEQNLAGVPLALDMSDVELREYFQRVLYMRRLFKQEEAAAGQTPPAESESES